MVQSQCKPRVLKTDPGYTSSRGCVVQDKERRTKMVVERPEPASHKVCSRCGEDKPAERFYRDASKPDGLQVRALAQGQG